MWHDEVVFDDLEPQGVVGSHYFDLFARVFSFLVVVIIRAVDSSVIAQLHLVLFDGNLNHGNDVVSLSLNDGCKRKLRVRKLNEELIRLQTPIDSLDGREVITSNNVVLVCIKQDVFNKVQLNHPLLILLEDRKNHERVKVAVFDARGHADVLGC